MHFTQKKKNIFLQFQVNRLNDTHAQLMVHWLGEGTNVMLCLAREPPPSPLDNVKTSKMEPSSVYISYNNGDTFEDKTFLFNITINNTTKNSSIDQFVTNPKYNTVSKCRILFNSLAV